MRSTHYYIIRGVMMLALLWSQSLRAQDNLYGIDNEIYALMQQLEFNDAEDVYMKKVEDMYNLAVKKNDVKAQVLAVSNQMVYYDSNGNLDKLRVYADKLRAISEEKKLMQYYYFAYEREILHLLESDVDEAMRLAKKMVKEASDDDSQYGMFSGYQQMGNVYKARHNYSLSSKYYNEALKIAPNLKTKQRTTDIYLNMSSLLENFSYKMRMFDRALNAALEPRDSFATYEAMCLVYGKFNRRDDFMKYYEMADEMRSRVEFNPTIKTAVVAYKMAFEGDYEQAYRYVDTTGENFSLEERLETGQNIAIREGNGTKALSYAWQIEDMKERMFVNYRGYEFAELTDLVANEELMAQRQKRDADRRRMELDEERLRMENEEMEAMRSDLYLRSLDIERSNNESNRQYAQYKDSLDNARNLLEQGKAKDMNDKQAGLNKTYLAIVIMLVIAILVFGAVMLYYRNTSERLLRKAKKLRKAKTAALEAAEMKNVFIQNMSHEIRTPLNAVMGFSQLMTIPGLPLSDEEKVEYAQHILNNSKMLTMLVDDILNIAEIEKGNYSVTPAPCSANVIMADAVSTAEYRAQGGVSVYYTSDVDDDFMIMADARRVQQVLINFLTNACKHTEKGSIHLHLSITDAPGMLSYSVTDTGCGIPKEQAENIFERFTKLNDFKQGTGLGLNICRLISAKMGGRVYCDTRYTDGARFVFEVPLQPAPASE